jgi:hypothetical protein
MVKYVVLLNGIVYFSINQRTIQGGGSVWSGPNLGSNESSEKPSHLIGHGSLLR